MAGLAIAIVIGVVILVIAFPPDPPVNKETNERNTEQLLQSAESTLETATGLRPPKDFEILLAASRTWATVDHEVEYNLVIKAQPDAIRDWVAKSKPFSGAWTKTPATSIDEIKRANQWRPMRDNELQCENKDENLIALCGFLTEQQPVSFAYKSLRNDHYQILVAEPEIGFVWFQDKKF